MSKLVEDIRNAHDIDANNCMLWVDSMITLHWIKKSPVKLDVFVGSRVGEIQELTKEMEWRHVDTKCNPGDIISRGISADKLIENNLWWHAPGWLVKPKHDWPESKLVLTEDDLRMVRCHERKTNAIVSVAIQQIDPVTNSKFVTTKQRLKQDDSHYGLRTAIYQQRQSIHFAQGTEAIRQKEDIGRKSPLAKLTPFINDGVLRLAGRIKRSNMPFDTIHPVVLSNKCTIVKLLVSNAHKMTLHGGAQLTGQYLRNKYAASS